MLSRELEQERRNVAQQLEKVSQGVRVLIPILNSYLGTLICSAPVMGRVVGQTSILHGALKDVIQHVRL